MVMADEAGKQNSVKKKGKNTLKKKTNKVAKISGKNSRSGIKEKEKDEPFNVDDVLYFGGEKEDFEKLLDVDVNEELVTGGVEDANEKLRQEIQNFLQGEVFDELSERDYGEEQPGNKNSEKLTKKEKEKSNAKIKKKGVEKDEKSESMNVENNEDEKSRLGKSSRTKTFKTDVEIEVGKTGETMIENKDGGRDNKSKPGENNITESKEKDKIRLEKKKKDKKRGTELNLKMVTNHQVDNEGKEEKLCQSTLTNETIFRSFDYKKCEKMLLKNAVPWFQITENIPKCSPSLYEPEIEQLYGVAQQYWETETELYQDMKENDRSSDAKWLRTVLTSGTSSDRVAALTMLNQESPIHCTRSLDALMNMSKKKSRREALVAIDSLRHLWVADLLPDYKLRKFGEFPLDQIHKYNKSKSNEETIKFLITMVYEDHLKKTYLEFIEILKNFSKDPLADIRTKIIGIAYELLQMKPEQEQALLSILVNKLGDPDRKVASKSAYLLTQLVGIHPNMKAVVVGEVERMMYRPNMSDKAQYYAICFLNQVVLSHEEKQIATKLISIYFSFFKLLVARDDKKKENKLKVSATNTEHRNKLLGGLLTGVNRAFPYVEDHNESYDEHLNTLFRLAHVKHFNTSVQAFMLIYQVMQSRQSISDRYYQALYAKLFDNDVGASCKHTLFLNLLYKSLKNDPVVKRVKAFVKRLLQICGQCQPSLLCGIQFLISEVIKSNPAINSMMQQSEDNEADDEEHFVDAPLDEELAKEKLNASDGAASDQKEGNKPSTGSWTFRRKDSKNVSYNINQRNPLYSGADNSCLWEIFPILSHFHPSVVHFASSVVNGQSIEYKGDPSQDFTLIAFLDKFMYRNPKQKEVEHGNSLMQRRDTSLRHKQQPVNSKVFLQKSEENIPCDQVFFYRYFKQQMLDKKMKTGKEGEGERNENEDLFDLDVDDIDFAGEVKKNTEANKKIKSIDAESDNESAVEDEDEDSQNSFNYDDIGNESSDEEELLKNDTFNDKDYEKALFEQLDSDGESINGEDMDNLNDGEDGDGDSGGGGDPMFADAADFSHLLDREDEDGKVDGVHRKQLQWEEQQQSKGWKRKKADLPHNRPKGNMKRKMNSNSRLHHGKSGKKKKTK